jgi:hypothetical protein
MSNETARIEQLERAINEALPFCTTLAMDILRAALAAAPQPDSDHSAQVVRGEAPPKPVWTPQWVGSTVAPDMVQAMADRAEISREQLEALPRNLLGLACRIRNNETLFGDDELADKAAHAISAVLIAAARARA